jgi:hypothetical protein
MQMLNSFHDRGLLHCSPAADLWMHDDLSDPGTEPFGGAVFWESPDLWVRHSDDNGTTHQEPEFGQDNWFYARISNRGSVTARAFVATFNVKPWAGVQFAFPADFVPFISAAVGFNLAPGASTVVKAKWPASMIPPKGTHACLLGQVYTPVDTTPAGAHVWDKNNLAQKNMTVLDVVPGDTTFARFQIGTLHERIRGLYRIELFRPPLAPGLSVSLLAGSSDETKRLFRSADKLPPIGRDGDVVKPAARTVTSKVRFLDSVRAELVGAGDGPSMLFELAPSSSILLEDLAVASRAGAPAPLSPQDPRLQRTAKLVEAPGRSTEILFNEGRNAGFPVMLEPSAQIKVALRISVPRDARPGQSYKLQLALRGDQGRVVGGISVQLNVVKAH